MSEVVPTHVVIGAGPVGTSLALRLAGEGTPVRVITRSGAGPDHPLVERRAADVTDLDAARSACRGAAAVFGCANTAYTAAAWRETWPKLQAGGLAGAAAAGGRYIAVENLYMYGPTDHARSERTPTAASGAKGRLRAELAQALLDQDEAPAASVRAADFFGPWVRESHVGERFVPRLLAGKGVRVVGDPDAPHAFTYVPDLVTAMLAVVASPSAAGRAWHAPVTTVSARELARAVAGAGAKVAAYPAWAFPVLSKLVPLIREVDEVRYQFDRPFLVDDSAIASELGVVATPLDDQVTATRDWWSSQRRAPSSTGTSRNRARSSRS